MSITSAELTAIRADIEALFDKTVIIQRPAPTSTGGYQIPASDTSAGTVNGLLAKANRSQIGDLAADREAETNYFVLTVPHDTDLRTSDKVSVDSDTYQIRQLWADHSIRGAVRALVSRID